MREGGFSLYQECIMLLKERGVLVDDIAELTHWLQGPYRPDISLAACLKSVHAVLKKKDVQHALLTGISLDQLTEKKALPTMLQTILEQDQPLYGIDEILALGVANNFGTIAITNFGFLDRNKVGVLKKLDRGSEGDHVFLDDLVAAIAASAAARLAYR
ncbi:MAG: hypothetical protein RLZ12_601 [Bacillota bacterium]|jgi:phosphatidylglycerophosphatase A